MTITADSTPYDLHLWSGAASHYAFTFHAGTESEVKAYTLDASGNPTVAAIATVDLSAKTVTLASEPETTPARLYIVRETPPVQEVSLIQNQTIAPTTLENALDHAVKITQDMMHRLNRAPQLPVTSSLTGLVFPDAIPHGVLKYTEAGTALEVVEADLSQLGTMSFQAADSVAISGGVIEDANINRGTIFLATINSANINGPFVYGANVSESLINSTPIGTSAPAPGAFTTLSASAGVSGDLTSSNAVVTGGAIDNTPIGATAPASGAFTTLSASAGVSGDLTSSNAVVTGGAIDSTPIGATTPASGAFTTLSASAGVSGDLTSSNAVVTGGAIDNTPIGATTPATGAFTTLDCSTLNASVITGLGTAATLDAGRNPYNLVQLEYNGALPNLNASNLTGIPMYMRPFGCLLTGTSGANTLAITPGARMSEDTDVEAPRLGRIRMTAHLTAKQCAQPWSEGANGGLLSPDSSWNNNTTYYVWLMGDDSGHADVMISTSLTPTFPPGIYQWDKKARLGAFITDYYGNLVSFIQPAAREFRYTGEPPWNVMTSNYGEGTNPVLRELSVPLGIHVEALINFRVDHSSSSGRLYISTPYAADYAPSMYGPPLNTGPGQTGSGQVKVLTNTQGQIRTRSSSTAGLYIMTLGWTDLDLQA